MPYSIQKKGGKFVIKKKTTGKVVGHSDSKGNAEASIRARYAAENGYKMKNK